MSGVRRRRFLVAAIIGNALDWFDFTVFGYLAAPISAQFFPVDARWAGVISTFGVFALSFLIRPLGGIVIGHYTDILGRKTMMVVVIGTMSVGTGMICLTPGYAVIGMAAPLLLVVARALQGLAAGGEFASATTFLIEYAPDGSRGLYGSWQIAGQGAAIFLSGAIVTLLSSVLTPEAVQSWGWRVPFFVGLIAGPIGFYIRASASESLEFLETRATSAASAVSPIRAILRHQKRRVVIGCGLVIGGTAALYVLFIFMPTYALHVLKRPPATSFLGPGIGGLSLAACCPLAGALSDRIGAKSVMTVAALCLLLVLYPAFLWLKDEPSLMRLAATEFAFGAIGSLYGGPFCAAIADLFPVKLRATALAAVYNVCVALFGGSAPLIVAWTIAATGNPLAPAYYVMVCILSSLAAVIALPPARRSL
ncbi:MAG TPA: MFS transporter [Stellaceae bacterium]|nr:MFS transporter [Stellaceae bacterium]